MRRRTDNIVRRTAENAAMAGLLAVSRGLLRPGGVQRLVHLADRSARTLRWVSPLRENEDTLARGRALAYRWSKVIPNTHCLHRAAATRVWLAAYKIDAVIVLGFRKGESLEGHAWLEVQLADAVTLMFVADEDGYETALTSR